MTLSQSIREQRLRSHLADSREALDDLGSALTLVHPDRARDTAQRCLETARQALDDARELVWTDRVAPAAPAATPRRDGAGEEDDDMQRRTFLASIAALTAAPRYSADRLLELSDHARRPGSLSAGQVAAMRELTGVYAQTLTTAHPTALARLVGSHLNLVTGYLDEAMTPALRLALGSAAAEVAALSGWVASTAQRKGDARAAHVLARDLAADDTQRALAFGSLAMLHAANRQGGTGSPAALRALAQANALLPDHAPATARAWLAGKYAEQQAAIGLDDDYRRTIARMDAVMAEDRPVDVEVVSASYSEGAALTFWGLGGVGPDQVRGNGGALTGDPLAVEHLRAAVANASEPLGEATLLIDLGQAHLRFGDLDAACWAVGEALPIAAQHGFTQRVGWVRAVRAQMRDDVHPAVRELDDRLAAV